VSCPYPEKYEGKLAPINNIQAFAKLKNPHSPYGGEVDLQYFAPPYWDLMHMMVSDSSGNGLRLRTHEETFWLGDTSTELPAGTVTIGPLGGMPPLRRAHGMGFFSPLVDAPSWWGFDAGIPTITVGPLGPPQ